MKFGYRINTLRLMIVKSPSRAITKYTIYSLIGTLLELGILIAIVVWGLPYTGIDMPLWAVIILGLVLIAFSGYTYTTGRRALNRKLYNEIKAMIGNIGIVSAINEDSSYIEIRGELWEAVSESELLVGDEVVVIDAAGFQLIVRKRGI